MKIKIIFSLFIVFAAVGLLSMANGIFSQGLENVQYPVAELGNCTDKDSCGLYCDKPENVEPCVNFAEKNNLMPQEEIEMARNFIAAGSKGPGGCTTKDSCETYCNSVSHINECVSFAEENNLMSPQELEEAKMVQAAIARGVTPPACGSKKSCDSYCESADHMEECIIFAAEAGFIKGKELEDSQKMLAAIKRGVIPPPCKGKEACDEYCNTPDNMEVCMNFAMEAGFMNEEEKADAQKMLQAIKSGVKPPNCRGKEECDSYCGEEQHFEECINFAQAAGFMSAEDAVMARKTGGKGPGDCKGKEECEAFCNNPDNQETCFNFAKDHGMIPEEDLKMMEEGKQRMKEALQQAPQAVLDCLNSEMSADLVEKLKTGEAMPSREIGDKMQACFQQMGGPGGQGGPGGPGDGGTMTPGQTGPGGCATPEECQNFQPGPRVINPGDQQMPQQAGPGGCKTPEECQSYCSANPEACQNFGSNQPQGQYPPPPDSQYQSQPQGEYNYPMPGQIQLPPCEGEGCQSGPLQGQPLQQSLEGNTLMPDQPLYPTEPQQGTTPPPIYEQQAPIEQQPQSLSEPSPEPSVQPSLLGAILQAFIKLFGI